MHAVNDDEITQTCTEASARERRLSGNVQTEHLAAMVGMADDATNGQTPKAVLTQLEFLLGSLMSCKLPRLARSGRKRCDNMWARWLMLSLLCEMGAAASCTASISTYPGYTGAYTVGGTVKVSKGASDAQIRLEYSLTGLPASTSGGLHVHSGTTCSSAASVLGHYWTPSSSADPWSTTYSTSSSSGTSSGSFDVASGYDVSENVGHAVVVHDSTDRIGCGVCQEDSNSSGLSDGVCCGGLR